jgi:hypothetical protein
LYKCIFIYVFIYLFNSVFCLKPLSKMWLSENIDRLVVARRSLSVKSYARSIFDGDGIEARVAVPDGGSVTGTF